METTLNELVDVLHPYPRDERPQVLRRLLLKDQTVRLKKIEKDILIEVAFDRSRIFSTQKQDQIFN